MEPWITFWGAVLFITLAFYSLLVVYVTIGGFSDIKKMFQSLSVNKEENSFDSDHLE